MKALEQFSGGWNRVHVFKDQVIFTGTNLTADPSKVELKDRYWIQKTGLIALILLGLAVGLDSIINNEHQGSFTFGVTLLILIPRLILDWRRSYQTIIPRSSITDVVVKKVQWSTAVDIHFINPKGKKRFRRISLGKSVKPEQAKNMKGLRLLLN